MKRLLFFAIIIACSYTSQAQSMGRSYKNALGVKFWDGGGVSFKTFMNKTNALEFIGYFYKNGTRITGLYEIHGNIEGAPGLKWYIGPGAHIGFYNKKYYDGNAVAGIDGVLGLDYKINNAPINMSLDWQPSFEFGDNRGFIGNWGGFAIRYAF